ncbi:MAG: class I SAM-dependent methyltransferase [Spirochaetales bacterium]|jgi:cyclopropane fatty-acyl-phospholipid synthase-like methyltransferase|nr:class I SAM-dependent methyltransferase [Spirochaetales bacterium]
MSDYNLEDIKRAYDTHAAERDAAELGERKTKHINEAIEFFRQRAVQTVLEIGSGPGNAAQVIEVAGFDIECTDISPKMIELVQAKGITGRVLDCREIESIGKTYDAVFSVNSLLHIPKAEMPTVLRGIHKVMKKNSIFILGLWGGSDIEGIYDSDQYRPKRFFSLLSQMTLLSLLTEVFQIEEYRRIVFDNDKFFHKVVMIKPTAGGWLFRD